MSLVGETISIATGLANRRRIREINDQLARIYIEYGFTQAQFGRPLEDILADFDERTADEHV